MVRPDSDEAARPSDAEKITINLGYVDLGRIDLLVENGFYGTRTEFIRTAIRNQLAAQAADLAGAMGRQEADVGLLRLTRDRLEAARERGERLDIRVVGLARIDRDVPADLALDTIRSIAVLGRLDISPALRAALHDRIR